MLLGAVKFQKDFVSHSSIDKGIDRRYCVMHKKWTDWRRKWKEGRKKRRKADDVQFLFWLWKNKRRGSYTQPHFFGKNYSRLHEVGKAFHISHAVLAVMSNSNIKHHDFVMRNCALARLA